MASTALSCVLWWRWLGILVMFHGMDRHRGIRTDSQDAARTAGGHSAQDTASRDTESPRESMSVRSERGHWSHGSTVSTPLKCRSFTESLIQIRTRFFLLICAFLLLLLLLSGLRTARGSGRGELLSYSDFHLLLFLYPSFSTTPLPCFPHISHFLSSSCSSPPFLYSFAFPVPSTVSSLLSSMLKDRFLLDEKSTSVNPLEAHRCVSLHFIKSYLHHLFTEVRFPFQQCKYSTCPAFKNELKVEMKQLTWDLPCYQVYNKHQKFKCKISLVFFLYNWWRWTV